MATIRRQTGSGGRPPPTTKITSTLGKDFVPDWAISAVNVLDCPLLCDGFSGPRVRLAARLRHQEPSVSANVFRGSIASRSASPTTLTHITTVTMAPPGASITQ